MSLAHDGSETVGMGVLVRYLHGELDEESARALARHLSDCGSCRSALEALAARESRISQSLRQADFPLPTVDEWKSILESARFGAASRKRLRRRLRVASWVLALAAGAAAMSPPVRAWVAERWAAIVGAPGPETDTPQASAGPATPGRAALGFQPEGPRMEIRLDARQDRGTLSVRFVDGVRSSVAISEGGGEQLGVGGQGLRIANPPGSVASYEVTVPGQVERISVWIDGLEPVELNRDSAAGGTVVIELSRGLVVRNPIPRDEE